MSRLSGASAVEAFATPLAAMMSFNLAFQQRRPVDFVFAALFVTPSRNPLAVHKDVIFNTTLGHARFHFRTLAAMRAALRTQPHLNLTARASDHVHKYLAFHSELDYVLTTQRTRQLHISL